MIRKLESIFHQMSKEAQIMSVVLLCLTIYFVTTTSIISKREQENTEKLRSKLSSANVKITSLKYQVRNMRKIQEDLPYNRYKRAETFWYKDQHAAKAIEALGPLLDSLPVTPYDQAAYDLVDTIQSQEWNEFYHLKKELNKVDWKTKLTRLKQYKNKSERSDWIKQRIEDYLSKQEHTYVLHRYQQHKDQPLKPLIASLKKVEDATYISARTKKLIQNELETLSNQASYFQRSWPLHTDSLLKDFIHRGFIAEYDYGNQQLSLSGRVHNTRGKGLSSFIGKMNEWQGINLPLDGGFLIFSNGKNRIYCYVEEAEYLRKWQRGDIATVSAYNPNKFLLDVAQSFDFAKAFLPKLKENDVFLIADTLVRGSTTFDEDQEYLTNYHLNKLQIIFANRNSLSKAEVLNRIATVYRVNSGSQAELVFNTLAEKGWLPWGPQKVYKRANQAAKRLSMEGKWSSTSGNKFQVDVKADGSIAYYNLAIFDKLALASVGLNQYKTEDYLFTQIHSNLVIAAGQKRKNFHIWTREK